MSTYGMRIKVELLNRNKTQTWLINEIKKILPNKYVDSSNLYKIMTGEISSPEICKAINTILELDADEPQSDKN